MKDYEQCLFYTFEKDGLYHLQCCGLVPGPGHVYATFIVGSEKALLIDNGFGDDDFLPYLRTLTDKPIIAAATHGHPDHIGGSAEFEAIYIAKEDWDHITMFYDKETFDKEQALLFGKTKVKDLDFDHFDLGGRIVRIIRTPGHTPGGVCFYDEKTKLMMTGDTMNYRMFLNLARPVIPLRVYKESLERLLAYDFDVFLGGHHPEPIPRSKINDVLGLIETFDPAKGKPYIREGFGDSVYLYTKGRGFGDPDYCGFSYDLNDLDAFLS